MRLSAQLSLLLLSTLFSPSSQETRPDGGCFFTGHRGGRICCWDLDLDTGTRATPDPYGDAARLTTESTYSATHIATVPWSAGGLRKGATSTNHRLALRGAPLTPQQLMLPGNLLGDVVDCVRWLPEGRLAAKSADGRLAVWDLKGKEVPKQLLSLRVPGTHPVGGSCQGAAAVIHGGRCRFSVTQDGAFICVGEFGRWFLERGCKVVLKLWVCVSEKDCGHCRLNIGQLNVRVRLHGRLRKPLIQGSSACSQCGEKCDWASSH